MAKNSLGLYENNKHDGDNRNLATSHSTSLIVLLNQRTPNCFIPYLILTLGFGNEHLRQSLMISDRIKFKT